MAVSRRNASKLLGGTAALGQGPAERRFRAFVRFEAGASVQELRLLPVSPRQVVVKTEAAQIVAVEPIRERRELALKLGATVALDPNVEGTSLVARIQEICRSPTPRPLIGGGVGGPDYVVEAVGGDLFPPKREMGPDPTGILSLQQAWQLCSPTGQVVTTSVGHPRGSMVSIPATQWANGAKNHHPGNLAGAHSKRDLPRYVKLVEAGLFNAKALATGVFPLERTREAFEAAAYRTTVGAVVVV